MQDDRAQTPGAVIFGCVMLFVANLLNYTDRFVINAVIGRVNFDGVTLGRTEQALVATAFTIGFLVAAPVVAWYADRARRVRILAICILAWTIATILSAVATSLNMLLLFRVIIGLGEAGCLVIGPTLIADYAAPRIRGKMLALFYLALPLGGALGYLIGGQLGSENWRFPLLVAGLPGLLIAVVVWLLPEPKRGGADDPALTKSQALNWTRLGGYGALLRNPVYLTCVLALTATAFSGYPLLLWIIEFFREHKAISMEEATSRIGPLIALAGIFGSLFAGDMGDRFYKMNKRAYMWMTVVSVFLGMPFLYLGLYSGPEWIYLPCLFCGAFFFFAINPLLNTQISITIPAERRAAAFGLTILTMHLLGDMLSPLLFGYVDQHLVPQIAGAPEGNTLFYTFLLIPVPVVFTGVLAYVGARKIPLHSPEDPKEPTEAA